MTSLHRQLGAVIWRHPTCGVCTCQSHPSVEHKAIAFRIVSTHRDAQCAAIETSQWPSLVDATTEASDCQGQAEKLSQSPSEWSKPDTISWNFPLPDRAREQCCSSSRSVKFLVEDQGRLLIKTDPQGMGSSKPNVWHGLGRLLNQYSPAVRGWVVHQCQTVGFSS